jgi:hypothetical protein
MFIIDYKKCQAMLYSNIKFKFFLWFTLKYSDKWTSICDKNDIIAQQWIFLLLETYMLQGEQHA